MTAKGCEPVPHRTPPGRHIFILHEGVLPDPGGHPGPIIPAIRENPASSMEFDGVGSIEGLKA